MKQEMTAIYGAKVTIVGSVLLTHRTTGKQKYFCVIQHGKDLTTIVTSEIRGMTQKKAAQLPQVPHNKIRIDLLTEENGYR